MKREICVFLMGLVWVTPVLAQVYKDKYENIVLPMEQAVERSKEDTANVLIPGAAEDEKTSARRYEEAVLPMDDANARHFTNSFNEEIPERDAQQP